MSIYKELGVRTLINAAGTVTRYGGSLMAPEVLDSMRGASQKVCYQFCLHLDEVQKKVGERIAAMLEVEAAYVTSSAACGLVIYLDETGFTEETAPRPLPVWLGPTPLENYTTTRYNWDET